MAYIQPPKRNQPKWNYGPPPSVGWWPASDCRNPLALRYWDGEVWSFSALHSFDAVMAASMARTKSTNPQIRWSARWWE